MSLDKEYIKFNVSNDSDFIHFESFFIRLSLDKELSNQKAMDEPDSKFEIDYDEYDKILPQYVKEYFLESLENKKWDIEGLLYMIILNLEIGSLSLEKKEKTKGQLKFESYSYPYGGTNSLIYLIRSFNLIPFEVNDVIDTDQIEWKTRFVYLLNGKEEYANNIEDNHEVFNQRPARSNLLTSIFNLFKTK